MSKIFRITRQTTPPFSMHVMWKKKKKKKIHTLGAQLEQIENLR